MLDSPLSRALLPHLAPTRFIGCVVSLCFALLVLQGTARAQSEEPPAAPAPDAEATAPAKLWPPSCLLHGEHSRIDLSVTDENAVAARLEFATLERRDAWYAVAATRSEQGWSAVLPQVASDVRVHYRLVEVNGAGATLARQPADGAFLADGVEQPCTTGTAATVPTAQITLTVPTGSPRVPPGFTDANVLEFVTPTAAESTPAAKSTPAAEPTPAAESTPAAEPNVIAPALTSSPAPAVSERRFAVSTGKRFRLTGADGTRHEGIVTSVDDTGVRFDKKSVVQWSAVERVEEYEGPGGKRILGALAGAAGGLALTLVYFVAAEDASKGGLYVGILGGAALGAMVVPGSWKTVDPIVGAPPVAKKESATQWLARHAFVVPQRGGAKAGIGLRF